MRSTSHRQDVKARIPVPFRAEYLNRFEVLTQFSLERLSQDSFKKWTDTRLEYLVVHPVRRLLQCTPGHTRSGGSVPNSLDQQIQ